MKQEDESAPQEQALTSKKKSATLQPVRVISWSFVFLLFSQLPPLGSEPLPQASPEQEQGQEQASVGVWKRVLVANVLVKQEVVSGDSQADVLPGEEAGKTNEESNTSVKPEPGTQQQPRNLSSPLPSSLLFSPPLPSSLLFSFSFFSRLISPKLFQKFRRELRLQYWLPCEDELHTQVGLCWVL